MIRTIRKRDGRIKPFEPQKISNAILAAMKGCGINDAVLANKIAYKIASENKYEIDIEQVQDMVEVQLMEQAPVIAKEYIKYREERSRIRQRNNSLNRRVKDILTCKNIQNSNANVDEYSFGGRKNESANALQKEIALDDFIRPEVAKAHRENRLYVHDLSEYGIGSHNCLFADVSRLLTNGFATRNGDVRSANCFATACQLIAVIFQIQSQVQFGGVATAHIDFDLAPFVKKSFIKHYKIGLMYVDQNTEHNWDDFEWKVIDKYNESDNKEFTFDELLYDMSITDPVFKSYSVAAFNYANDMLEKEGSQSAQALYHNLNTLESRAGAQVPFTSINTGRDKSYEGRLVTKWMMQASIDGIGKHHETPIFPISIFQYKKGVNAKPEDPNYDLKKLAIQSLIKRIYPNIVNGDWSQNEDDQNNPDTFMATMGCVDGVEVITYLKSGFLFVESFERTWDRLSRFYEIKTSGTSEYMDLDDVLIFDSSSNGFVKTHRIIKNIDASNWRRIVFNNGRMLLATGDHPLPVKDKGRTFVDNMQIGDQIPCVWSQYNSPDMALNVSEDYAWALGAILCDGQYQKDIVSSFGLDETDIIDKYIEVTESLLNSTVHTYQQERGIKGEYYDVSIRGANKASVRNHLTTSFEGINKENRHIPQFVFSWSYENRLAFLCGMIDADGYSNVNGNRGCRIQIGSTNHELAIQQSLLAQSLGLPAKIYINHYDSKDQSKIRYRVEFSCCEDMIRYMASEKKKIKMTKPVNPSTPGYVSVTRIENLGYRDRFSYCVTTESDRFDVSGINSHNCRTLIGKDRHGLGYSKVGRGNVSPITINLPKIGIKHGICLGERQTPDTVGFFSELKELLKLGETALVDRFYHICSQDPRSGTFMYENGTIADFDKVIDKGIYEAMKHGTQALGFIGLAEACQAMFDKDHADGDLEVDAFALKVIETISDYAAEASERNDLNFSCYATPAENSCYTICQGLQKEFGKIPKVCDRDYITNSFHVPVWKKISIFDKLRIEARYTKYAKGGCITYVELESSVMDNPKAIEDIIDFAMDLDIPYLAFNFPIDTCDDCGYQGEIETKCPKCGGTSIKRLRRVTGYLTTDYRKFNKGKISEVHDRVKHSAYTKLE